MKRLIGIAATLVLILAVFIAYARYQENFWPEVQATVAGKVDYCRFQKPRNWLAKGAPPRTDVPCHDAAAIREAMTKGFEPTPWKLVRTTIRFMTEEGERVETWIDLNAAFAARHGIGGSFKVAYSPYDPRSTLVAGDAKRNADKFGKWLAICPAFLGFGGLFLFAVRRD